MKLRVLVSGHVLIIAFTLPTCISPSSSLGGTLQTLIYQPLHHLLQHGASTSTTALEVRSNTLLHVLANLVNLDIDIVALPLVAHNDLLLSVRDHHDLPPALLIVDSSDSERRAVQTNVSLLHNVPEHKLVSGLQAESDRIAILPGLCDLGNSIHMTLHKVAAHSCVRSYCALQVHAAAFFQTTQVRPAQSFGCNANLELIFAELGHGQASAIDTYAVAKVHVCEDLGAARDGQAGAAAAAGGFVMLHKARDSWLGVSAAAGMLV
jgi:hypothetical protein